MKILNHSQIKQKITRLAYQIAEYNYDIDSLCVVGINNNGMRFAKLLESELGQIGVFDLELSGLQLNPADPLSDSVQPEKSIEHFRDKNILIVDDVANTGRTLFYSFTPFCHTLPRKVQCAVLVDRRHKRFPVHVDFVGLSLATTLKENIDVDLKDSGDMAVYMT